jgi:hypothetical protein
MNRPPKSSRLRAAAITTLLGLALSGCARINDVGKLLLASSMPAVALVNDTLLVGDATLFMDRSGRLSLESSPPGLLKCMGEMRYTATQTGVVNLRCSDGTEARLLFSTLSEVMGFGSGSSARGPVTLTFGMEPAEAAAYLNLPAGQRIVSSFEGGTRLEPLSSPGVTP